MCGKLYGTVSEGKATPLVLLKGKSKTLRRCRGTAKSLQDFAKNEMGVIDKMVTFIYHAHLSCDKVFAEIRNRIRNLLSDRI